MLIFISWICDCFVLFCFGDYADALEDGEHSLQGK